jgi:ABC-type lipoprotein export system ATPase subunit
VIDAAIGNGTATGTDDDGGKSLSGGVIAGLAVVGALIALAVLLLGWGCMRQRRARRVGAGGFAGGRGGVGVEWNAVSYAIPSPGTSSLRRRKQDDGTEKVILDGVSGRVAPGTFTALLGPSGAGKTTLVEILAGKHKAGRVGGGVAFSPAGAPVRVGFVPQQDVLPAALTVREALLFAARLRLPESVPESEKVARVDEVLQQLGIAHVGGTRIGSEERRGVSGGEMRRVSIGLELVARPDVLILDEPTSGEWSFSLVLVLYLS